jgi:hypothetical protein
MVKRPAGRTAVGTRWQEYVRLAPGCWMRIESVVTKADEPVRLGMDFQSSWFTGHLTYEITGTADGSTLHHHETLRPRPCRGCSPRSSSGAYAHACSTGYATSKVCSSERPRPTDRRLTHRYADMSDTRTATDLWRMSATELAAAIRSGQASSLEVVEAHLRPDPGGRPVGQRRPGGHGRAGPGGRQGG